MRSTFIPYCTPTTKMRHGYGSSS